MTDNIIVPNSVQVKLLNAKPYQSIPEAIEKLEIANHYYECQKLWHDLRRLKND